MNKLTEEFWQDLKTTGPEPYKAMRIGDIVDVVDGHMTEMFKKYYPESNCQVIITEVSVFDDTKHDYIITPIGYEDNIEVSHWDIRQRDLQESRMFTIANKVRPGVMIKDIETGKTGRIKEPAVLENNEPINPDSLVEIMISTDEKWKTIESFIN